MIIMTKAHKCKHQASKAHKPLLLTALTSILITGTLMPISVQAVEADPCGAVLCLSGASALGGNLGDCTPHIKKYFSFNAFSKKGLFNPHASYVKRYRWLNGCNGADPKFKQMIMANYGYLQRSPF